VTPLQLPTRVELDEPAAFLRWLSGDPVNVELGKIDPIEMWGLVALATLARLDGPAPLRVKLDSSSRSCQFAHAVGFADVISGSGAATPPAEKGRTVKLARIQRQAPTEHLSDEISRLLVSAPALEDTRRTLYYVLNELLRNVVQHSQDSLGGVVGAQLNRGGRNTQSPMVQVAVADAGVGIPANLSSRHQGLRDSKEALEKALWPHISSTFDEGETGSAENAGMGLFIIAEMTKLVGGRLVIASRGATLILEGDANFENPHGTQRFLETGLGYAGTLVSFEMPADAQQDYEAMLETIRERARERTPRRAVHKWLSFSKPPEDTQRFLVRHSQIEDTRQALQFAQQTLLPRLVERKPVALDFSGIPTCTQSYVHSLLYEALRVAWALKTPIYILNAQPAVKSTLDLLENYALGG
jgi:hypothetical protein